jgi:hypothetical protein
MDDQPTPDVSLDTIEDWIVKYRAALAQDLIRSQSRSKRFRSAVEDFVRQWAPHFNFTTSAGFHFLPAKFSGAGARKSRTTPDVAHLG